MGTGGGNGDRSRVTTPTPSDRQVLLDTDLGSDVDDELALALLWGSPEATLLGVATTYGDTVLRARIALRMAALTGRSIRVAAGERSPWSGEPVWWAGHEGDSYGDLSQLDVPAGEHPSAGARLLARHADGAHLLAIAPLTTVATMLRTRPGAARGLASITVMGGDWTDPSAMEHNIASDVDAARAVFRCGADITVVGVDITRRVHLAEPDILRIERRGALGAILAAAMRAWIRRWDEDVEVPHDPVAILALLRPDLFAFSAVGAATVDEAGRVLHRPGEGTVRIATDVDVNGVTEEIMTRVLQGLHGQGLDGQGRDVHRTGADAASTGVLR